VQLVSRIREAGFAPTFNDPEIEKQTTINASSDSALQKTTSKAPRAKKVLSKNSEVKLAYQSSDIILQKLHTKKTSINLDTSYPTTVENRAKNV
jgi:hypothetical protein